MLGAPKGVERPLGGLAESNQTTLPHRRERGRPWGVCQCPILAPFALDGPFGKSD